MTASQFDRTRIEVCISRLSFLEVIQSWLAAVDAELLLTATFASTGKWSTRNGPVKDFVRRNFVEIRRSDSCAHVSNG